MRAVNIFVLLSAICGIKAAVQDVTCEVKKNAKSLDTFVSEEYVDICEFYETVVINVPSKLSNSLNENVTELKITENKNIEFMPQYSSTSFPNLRKIFAYDCSMKSLNKFNFQSLTKLIGIDMVNNELDTIDDNSFDDLVNLQRLSFQNNKISELPSKIFANLENLESLDLGYNQLRALDVELFKNNKKIEDLSLSDNTLKTLPDGIFDQCEKLTYLDLSNNKIETIAAYLLSKLTLLQIVSFSFNPLDFIDLEIFDKNTELSYVDFNNIATRDIRNIDKVDQMKKIESKGLSFLNGCINGQFDEKNWNNLKNIFKIINVTRECNTGTNIANSQYRIPILMISITVFLTNILN